MYYHRTALLSTQDRGFMGGGPGARVKASDLNSLRTPRYAPWTLDSRHHWPVREPSRKNALWPAELCPRRPCVRMQTPHIHAHTMSFRMRDEDTRRPSVPPSSAAPCRAPMLRCRAPSDARAPSELRCSVPLLLARRLHAVGGLLVCRAGQRPVVEQHSQHHVSAQEEGGHVHMRYAGATLRETHHDLP